MDWTKEDASAWRTTWAQPHMAKGLMYLWNRMRPRRSPLPVTQGFDLTPVFIKSSGFYEGCQEAMDMIDIMGRGPIERKPMAELPEAFSHIAREDEDTRK